MTSHMSLETVNYMSAHFQPESWTQAVQAECSRLLKTASMGIPTGIKLKQGQARPIRELYGALIWISVKEQCVFSLEGPAQRP